jgi:2-polyprenyl-3-methyl-5-hydroxy-6-metoxy-1,4-benzoquinol methylase
MNRTHACRLCGDNHLTFLFAVKGCDILRCQLCDFTQVSHTTAEDDLKKIYGYSYFHNDKYRDPCSLERENEKRLSLVRRFLNKGVTVLEAGCGTGDFISLAKHEYEMSGFDLSEAAVDEAKNTNRDISDRLWVGSLDKQRLEPSSFDAVCLWDVIEHLSDPLQVCRKLMSCLRPGGYLFLSTPVMDGWPARLLGKYWPFMTPPEHLAFFSSRSLQHLFERTLGGRIIESSLMGKWVNCGFLAHKIARVAPARFSCGVAILHGSPFAKRMIYVPGFDIRYMAVKKMENR